MMNQKDWTNSKIWKSKINPSIESSVENGDDVICDCFNGFR